MDWAVWKSDGASRGSFLSGRRRYSMAVIRAWSFGNLSTAFSRSVNKNSRHSSVVK